jgi:hypothetical protein
VSLAVDMAACQERYHKALADWQAQDYEEESHE